MTCGLPGTGRRQRYDHNRGPRIRESEGHTGIYRDVEYGVSFLPKVQIEVAVPHPPGTCVGPVIAFPSRQLLSLSEIKSERTDGAT
jgi:nitrogen regulatory protein PII